MIYLHEICFINTSKSKVSSRKKDKLIQCSVMYAEVFAEVIARVIIIVFLYL